MTVPETNKPLTILIAAETYRPNVNGAAQFGYRLAKGMKARGHNVHVLACRADNGKSFTEFGDEGTVHRLKSHGVFTHTSTFAFATPGKSRTTFGCSSTRCSPTSFTSKAIT